MTKLRAEGVRIEAGKNAAAIATSMIIGFSDWMCRRQEPAAGPISGRFRRI
jgi:hypothetical protein